MGRRRGRPGRNPVAAAAGILGDDLKAIRATFAILLLGAAPAPVDLLIRGGTVYTGSDAPFVGDVAVSGDRIVRVGRELKVQAARTIDATGLVVAPGFIDPHAHIGDQLLNADAQARLVLAFLMQGVTTSVIGNDGGGATDVKATLASATAQPVGINYATWVGFGPLRGQVVGAADRAPTPEELARMEALVDRAMCDGALGLSTGLFYAPQSYAKTAEVAALARVAGRRGGGYDSHLRDESSYTIGLKGAVAEALEIGQTGRLPVHIAHIKALGVDVQGQAPAIVAMIEAAQRRGQKVTADQYPWSASGTDLAAALLPRWAQDGGRAELLKRFDDPATLARIKTEMTENLRRRGGAAALLITEGPRNGRTLAEIAGTGDPVAAAITVIREDDPNVASFNQTEADIAVFMKRPWVMTGSDASPGHPRYYGSFARKYAKYVVTDQVVGLREFIERSSRLTADTFALKDRGRLRRGGFADVLVFDPAKFRERATYQQPTLFAEGVRTVLVNGRVAVDDGQPTGIAAGRALPRKAKGRCA